MSEDTLQPETKQPVSPKQQKLAINFLIRFYIVFKILRLYAENNELLQEQTDLLYQNLRELKEAAPEINFKIKRESIFFNQSRLKFSLANYPIFKFLLEEFRKREIGLLTIEPEVSREELLRAVNILGQKRTSTTPFEDIVNELVQQNVERIRLEKLEASEKLPSPERSAARLFFLSILHLREVSERNKENEQIRLNTTRRLIQSIFNHLVDNESFLLGLTTIKNHDEYTLNHSVNVSLLAVALGRRLGLSRAELVDLGLAAFFHDLGKIDTPLEILNKPGQLTDDERKIMELHPHQGAEKLVQLREFRRLPVSAIHVAMEHHIKEDLTGYPRLKIKSDVNLYSRIVKVCDFFDAITTKRVYRKKTFTRSEALSLMLENIGSEFNPVILKTFVQMMGIFPVGSLVLLNTGEVGLVVENNQEARFLLRPRVKIIVDSQGQKVDGEVVDLTEVDPQSRKFRRTIVKEINPEDYGLEVPDYFLVQAM
ncbi:MAG: HD-GYP domain-containing protein [Candidatus Saccharicenans sp.]|jgi:HD-GYP domain-containing protein (c-di-GMP phosphodiesterase class II)|nr:HD-GYP domain-containing protein [Candidatus Saccharicenans sp.]MDH7574290.1 HD-GYP domain-containing protein [Candidatus Saccharicenans sp.]